MAKESTEGTAKASFNIKPELIKKLRYVALMDETTQTDIVDKLLVDFIDKWEKKNGPIPGKHFYIHKP